MGLFDMDSWFGGGDDNQTTQTSSTQMPQFFEDFSRRSFNALDNLTQQEYQPYNLGPRIAGFSDLQTDVINKFKASSAAPYTAGSALQGLNDLGSRISGAPDALQQQAQYLQSLDPMGLAEIVSSGTGQAALLSNIGNALQGRFGAGSGQAVSQLQALSQQLQGAAPGTDIAGQQRQFVNTLSAGDIADLLRSPMAAQFGPGFRQILGTRLSELGSARTNTPMGQAIDMARSFSPISADQISPTGTLTADQISAGSIAGTDLNQYMNPYIGSVVDTTMEEIRRQGDIANLGIKANATAAGGFGDARHGVAEAELRGRQQQLQNQAMAQLMMGGYDRATALAGEDIANDLRAQLYNQAANLEAGRFNIDTDLTAQRVNQAANLEAERFNQTGQLDAAGLLGNLAAGQQDMDLAELAALWDIGAQEQGMAQSNFDLMYQDWLNQRDFPLQQIERRLSAIQGRPFSTTVSSSAPGPNQTAQDIGALAAMLGAIGSISGNRTSR